MSAVVAAGELEDGVAAGGRARDPQRVEGGLGARAAELHGLGTRDELHYLLRQPRRRLVQVVEGRPPADLLLDRGHDTRVRMAENQRPGTQDEVNELAPVGRP